MGLPRFGFDVAWWHSGFRFMKIKSWLALGAASLVLSSCGGGGGSSGGGGTPTPPPNRAPSFTSASSISIAENSTAVVVLRATDPDGDDLTFTILPGKDSALFAFIGTEGNLEFLTAPSFENPLDANGDNVYEVDVRVSDGVLTATQTIRVTVTNTGEGVGVRRLATGLGTDGSVKWLNESQRIMVVSSEGDVQFVDRTTGAVTTMGRIGGLGGNGKVVGIGVDGLDFRQGYFFALVKSGLTVELRYVNSNTPTQQRTVWSYVYPSGANNVSASITMEGNNPLIALSDGGNRNAAQDRDDPRGNLMRIIMSGDPATPASLTASAGSAAWGLRAPLLSNSDNLERSPVDRGENYNEYNQADFDIANSQANFEWPIRDGLAAASYSGTITGNRVAPLATQALGGGVGRWISYGGGLQGEGWFGVILFSDASGRIYTWDSVYFGAVEDRTVDFDPDAGMIDGIVSMDDTDYSYGPTLPLLMLDKDGDLFVVRLGN